MTVRETTQVAITGGTGFVGSHVTALLKQAGYLPIHLEPLPPPTGSKWVHWELEWDVERMTKALQGAGVLIHLAAFIPSNLNDIGEASKCLSLNALGTSTLLRASLAAGVRQFIHASTAALYASDKGTCAENAALFPRRAVAYLASKLAAEVYVGHAAADGSLICNVLRLASVYGPGMRNNGLVARCVHELMSSGSFVIADGNRYRSDLVYVGDVARAFVNCIGKRASRVYNIGSGRLTSPEELALCAADLLALSPSSIIVAPPNEGPPPGLHHLSGYFNDHP